MQQFPQSQQPFDQGQPPQPGYVLQVPVPAPQPGHVPQAPVPPQPAPAFDARQAQHVLSCQGLSKSYGARVALNDVTFSVPRGRVVGLLGPNGSGKTTLIKLAAGLLQPTGGAVLIEGEKPGTSTKARVSYLPERPYFAPSMRVRECVAFFADFYRDFDRALAEELLYRLAVPTDAPMSTLSKGTKEKVQLVLVMARRAALYLLDEPIGGVDPATRDFILETIIAQYRRDATLLISTHLVSDVEKVLDDFIFLQYGTMVLHAPVAYVHEQFGVSLDEYFRGAFRW